MPRFSVVCWWRRDAPELFRVGMRRAWPVYGWGRAAVTVPAAVALTLMRTAKRAVHDDPHLQTGEPSIGVGGRLDSAVPPDWRADGSRRDTVVLSILAGE
ncbi:MAG: hypothetical protein J0I11_17900 [Actinobacteria bacterium]|nr:hypothetical protein [Actinomycetota bacterium]